MPHGWRSPKMFTTSHINLKIYEYVNFPMIGRLFITKNGSETIHPLNGKEEAPFKGWGRSNLKDN